MAGYATSYSYAGTFMAGQFTPYVFTGEYEYVFDNEGDVFAPGETITVNGQDEARFIGFSENGILIQGVDADPNGTYYYYTNIFLDGNSPIAINSTDSFTYCFLAGTQIGTPTGAVVVQDLAIGDLVLTADGRTVPVRWIGRQTVVTAFGPDAARRPVRIVAGALGQAQPTGDLCLTADHALLLDGVLVQAGALVNGTTVRRMTEEDLGARYTVFHVETEYHELILAEGVPAETFVDNVSRRRFDNFAEFAALDGDGAPAIEEMDLPRVKSARQLPNAIRLQLEARAAALGWTAVTAA